MIAPQSHGAAAAFADCERLRQVELDWFRAGGVSVFLLAGYELDPSALGWAEYELLRRRHGWQSLSAFQVRRARVQFLRGGYFLPAFDKRADAEALEPALILPNFDEDGALADLVAWQPKSMRLASLYRASGLLGWPMSATRMGDEPLRVHRDPLSWLASCRDGVVVVHASLARPVLLRAQRLQAADVAHGEAIEAMLRKVRLPKIVVPEAGIGRAAA